MASANDMHTREKGEAHDFPDNIQHKLRGGHDVRNKNNGELTPGKKQGVSRRLHKTHDKVRNERIAARAMGDATRETKMGDSKSTTKVSPLGRWGTPRGRQKKGDSKPAKKKKIADRAMGDAARATKMGNLNASLLGRWGTPLGQQIWGTQSPQHKYGCRVGDKYGGLEVRKKNC
jgi:hypothetical protein